MISTGLSKMESVHLPFITKLHWMMDYCVPKLYSSLIILETTGATLLNTQVSSQDLTAALNSGISGTSEHFAAGTVSFTSALNQPEKGTKEMDLPPAKQSAWVSKAQMDFTSFPSQKAEHKHHQYLLWLKT